MATPNTTVLGTLEDSFLVAAAPLRWGYDFLTDTSPNSAAESTVASAGNLAIPGVWDTSDDGGDSDSDSSSPFSLSLQSWGIIAAVLFALLLVLLLTKSLEDII